MGARQSRHCVDKCGLGRPRGRKSHNIGLFGRQGFERDRRGFLGGDDGNRPKSAIRLLKWGMRLGVTIGENLVIFRGPNRGKGKKEFRAPKNPSAGGEKNLRKIEHGNLLSQAQAFAAEGREWTA